MEPSSGVRQRRRRAHERRKEQQSSGNRNARSYILVAPPVDTDELEQSNLPEASSSEESDHKSSQISPNTPFDEHCHNEALSTETSSEASRGFELHNESVKSERTKNQKQPHQAGVDVCELNNNDIIELTRRTSSEEQGCRKNQLRQTQNFRPTEETDHDDMERRDNHEDQESNSELDRDKSVGDSFRIQPSARDASDSSSGGTIHSDHQNSTGYNADESLSAYCVDSDDKSSSTISLFGSSDKPIILRPRMGAALEASAAAKLVQGADKLESGSECESCTCRGVQDDKSINGCHSTSQSRAGKRSKEWHSYRRDNHRTLCRCRRQHEQKLHLGEQTGKCSVSSQSNETPNSAKYSELTGRSRIYQRLLAILRIGKIGTGSQPTGQLRRRRSRRESAVELNEHNLESKLAGERTSQGPEKLVEWLRQQPIFVTGAELDQSDMPSNPDYGTSSRYQALVSGGRRVSTGRRHRLHESSGHLRLGNNYYRKQAEPSCLQELKRLLLLLIIVGICAIVLWQIYVVLTQATNFLGTVENSPSKFGEYTKYAVSTDAEPCAIIGQKLLDKGGHAVDAALATLICMGLALPNSLGLGGGCLMTIYDNTTKRAYAIDGREVAPDYASENMFVKDQLSASRGPLSVGVPGELAAYWEAHQLFGRLHWSELFEDTIKMAEQGFPTTRHLSDSFRDMNHARYNQPDLIRVYTNNATGDYYSQGEIMRLPVIAQTLRRIRDHGAKEFYEGQIGQLFIEDLQKLGGKMTMENLRNYKAIVRPALLIDLADDVSVYTQPIPGSGLVLSIILRIMKQLGYYKNFHPKHSFESAALYYHHLVESFKFAYAQRAALEDLPDDTARMEALIANITSESFIEDAVRKIDNSQTLPLEAYGGLEYFKEDHGTAHVSVMDKDGNSVAITSSINLVFGSGVLSPRTGIIYNDIMDDFTSPNTTNKFGLPPSRYNRIKPGRRPLSSMAPSVFVDAKKSPKLIIGASGGSRITSAIASVAIRNVFFDDDIKTAIDGPRLHNQFLPNEVWYEKNFPPELLASLQSRSHFVRTIPGRSSVVMAVACNYSTSGDKHITANSDYRKGGSVAGS